MSDTSPENIQRLLKAYPEQIISFDGTYLHMKNGETILYDDHVKRHHKQIINHASVKDQFHWPYSPGTHGIPPKEFADPGRPDHQDLFTAMYGDTKDAVLARLTTIDWCPKLTGQRIRVTTTNGVDQALAKVSETLDTKEEWKPYVENIGGTFAWRKVSGSDRLSLHSFGIAIDINVSKSNYWQWDNHTTDEDAKIGYKNHIPIELVEIFEASGFIWGGKWYHYDTMHFEYRPEFFIHVQAFARK